jgi:hypothetical protein
LISQSRGLGDVYKRQYVNGKRVGTPVTVKIGVPVQIGNTVFELRA